MNDLTLGVLLYLASTGAVLVLMVNALRRARTESAGGGDVRRLAPYLLLDLLLTAAFAAWLWTRL